MTAQERLDKAIAELGAITYNCTEQRRMLEDMERSRNELLSVVRVLARDVQAEQEKSSQPGGAPLKQDGNG